MAKEKIDDSCAPICILAFNRPRHLHQTLAALAANDLARESTLTIICDGPRDDREREFTDEVRATAHAATGFRHIFVTERDTNWGLAHSVIIGVTELLDTYDNLIVVEDDLITSPYFLRYMNDGLKCYADDERVASIHGYCFPHTRHPTSATFFLKGADCLGWGTWKRAWRHFNPDALALLTEIRKRGEAKAFNRNDNYDYTGLLTAAAQGKVSSWGVRWLASAWLNDMYTLYPKESLIFHNGSDGSGTHCSADSLHDVPLAEAPVLVQPIPVREDQVMAKEFCRFLASFSGGPWGVKKKRIKDRFPRLYTLAQKVKTSGQSMRSTLKKILTRYSVRADTNLRAAPISRLFGLDRGTPIDRRYIEAFLGAKRTLIKGVALEIADSTYSKKFGDDRVSRFEILHKNNKEPGCTMDGDLEIHHSLPENAVDTFVCTQTLTFLFDIHTAVRNIHRVLVPGGVILCTLSGISPISRYDADRWGDFWRFTPQSAERLFKSVFRDVEVETFGNYLSAKAILDGLAVEDFSDPSCLDKPDPDYPVLIAIKAVKSADS